MTTKKKVIFTGVFVAIVIVATLQIMKMTGWEQVQPFALSRLTREITLPVQKGMTFITEKAGDFFAYFTSNEKLREQNEGMSRRIAELEEQLFTIKEQEIENERLKSMLAYKDAKAKNYQLVLAKVIGRDPGSWYQTILIDRGLEHGLRRGLTVVNHDGLVGMILNVTNNTSEVVLLLDTESAVGARVAENRITPGVVVGTGRDGILEMIHLPHDTQIATGQSVLTSGLGGVYPRGIRIGSIAEISTDANGLMKTALIKPFVDFARLEEVFVIAEVISPEEDAVFETDDAFETGGENNP